MQKILIVLSVLYGGFCGVAYACKSNEIDINGDGTQCETAKFSITTTNLTANTTFKFAMSAMGTFYVDWGDGTVDTIIRTDTTETLYNHTYTTGGVKTIRFSGLATGYSGTASIYTDFISAIRFGRKYYLEVPTNNDMTPELVDKIDGVLTEIFPRTRTTPRFTFTFSDTNISRIPANLFNMSKGPATAYMFGGTFWNCQKLESIPANLFDSFTGISNDTFRWCFYHCIRLKSIPDGLFSTIVSIRDSAHLAFENTFLNCANLKGYIPPSTFAGLIANGSPYDNYSVGMMSEMFSDTNLATSCPAGTVQFITGYESYWNGKVSCVDENLVCAMGEYLPAHWYQCEQCPENNYCVGGTYPYSETITSGITQCASGLYSPSGMWEAAQCGRILHVGDGFVYLRATKKTSPSLHLDLDHDGVADYFGNMTTLDVPMSRDTQRKLKVRYNNTTYSIYDDSVELSLYE